MASFSVVSNIASVNAQANLSADQPRPEQGADSACRAASASTTRATTRPVSRWPTPTGRQVAILNQGIRNANDGLSALQIKDGALNNISTLLDRLATLATQSASTSDDVGPSPS